MEQLLIPTNKGGKVVLVKNIIRVEASSSYSKIHFSNERPLLVAKVLQWFEDHLPDDLFCRIHRAHLVNRIHVSGAPCLNSLVMSNGDIVQISRRKKKDFKFTARQDALVKSLNVEAYKRASGF